jgi:hypothetical protein
MGEGVRCVFPSDPEHTYNGALEIQARGVGQCYVDLSETFDPESVTCVITVGAITSRPPNIKDMGCFFSSFALRSLLRRRGLRRFKLLISRLYEPLVKSLVEWAGERFEATVSHFAFEVDTAAIEYYEGGEEMFGKMEGFETGTLALRVYLDHRFARVGDSGSTGFYFGAGMELGAYIRRRADGIGVRKMLEFMFCCRSAFIAEAIAQSTAGTICFGMGKGRIFSMPREKFVFGNGKMFPLAEMPEGFEVVQTVQMRGLTIGVARAIKVIGGIGGEEEEGKEDIPASPRDVVRGINEISTQDGQVVAYGDALALSMQDLRAHLGPLCVPGAIAIRLPDFDPGAVRDLLSPLRQPVPAVGAVAHPLSRVPLPRRLGEKPDEGYDEEEEEAGGESPVVLDTRSAEAVLDVLLRGASLGTLEDSDLALEGRELDVDVAGVGASITEKFGVDVGDERWWDALYDLALWDSETHCLQGLLGLFA